MKVPIFPERFPESTPSALSSAIQEAVPQLVSGGRWVKDSAIYEVFLVCSVHPELFSTPRKGVEDLRTYFTKWVKSFDSGFENRASKRAGKPVSTIADPMVDKIIGTATKLSEEKVKQIVSAHRLGMAAENILGLLLEEYIAKNVAAKGWFCCWGNAVRSIDFISNRGELLQIKNRSNSENSSSVRVRDNTKILHWFRIDATNGKTQWSELEKMTGATKLSEEGFGDFVVETMKTNPVLLRY